MTSKRFWGLSQKKYFRSDSDMDLTAVYNEVFSMEKDQVELLKEDLVKRYHTAEATFESAPEEDRRFLKLFFPFYLSSEL